MLILPGMFCLRCTPQDVKFIVLKTGQSYLVCVRLWYLGFVVCMRLWWVLHSDPPGQQQQGGTPHVKGTALHKSKNKI